NVTPVKLFPPARHPFLWILWFEVAVARFLKRQRIDLFVSTDGQIPLTSKVPAVTVIHAINFEHFPQNIPFTARCYYRFFFKRFAKKAHRIATVSEYSKSDICKTYNIPESKIDVVYNGANSAYTPLEPNQVAAVRERITNGAPYFVFVGALNPRKNVARLLQAFNLFKQQTNSPLKLVIVGEKMFKTTEISEAYNQLSYKDDVVFSGRLNIDQLSQVTGAALAMVYVPYFEGFGIPILEAMSCDVPLVASTKTSIPEVAGEAAYYVDPFSVESIAQGMKLIATDPHLRDALIAKGRIQRQRFSWDKTASKLYQCINTTIEQIC
ncbi:MAG TPA: glycosyltransferase family 1 protein, partial [Tenuifilaceae bacterium]|nr:glycosyltransferase family 1 protein [Tenuifilaceae bacterium]